MTRPQPAIRLAMCAVLLVAALVAGAAPAAEPDVWPQLSARKWSPTEIGAHRHGERLLSAELRRQGLYQERWHEVHDLLGERHVSRKSRELLRGRGRGEALFESGAKALTADKAAGPDVLRVLLVRVAFENNRAPNLTTIAPSGDFMLDPLTDPGPLEIDPPPHGKAYFESHMEGLSQYYSFMSGGRLQIESRVLPEGENDSYKLSDVADYGPGAGRFWTIATLEKLVQDMISTSDEGILADGLGISLADYDDETPFTYVIFVHAGSDWQSDINGDSPNDIPTFFVNLGEPVALGGTNPAGNPAYLGECSVIPETTNQDGNVGSIAAALYHEFGHALGLPDVYNTTTGLPSVGIWDLMDSGTNLPVTLGAISDAGDTTLVFATGLLPPSLSAWCKWYLGWLEVGEVNRPFSSTGDYLLPAVGVPREQYARYRAGFGDFNANYPQAYRVGASPREYVLLENRWVPGGPADTPFDDLRFERDEATGVVQYLAGLVDGEWENSGLYDYFMPAGGLLAWHVNADRIASELADNTINAYGDGLRLIEADGIQDIGVLNSYVLGWFGSWRDPFGGLDPNGNPTGYLDLYPERAPSSRNFDRSLSGIRLSDMTRRVPRTASVMKFRASLAPIRDGFPWQVAALDSVEAARSGGTAGARRLDPASLTAVTVGGEQVLVFNDAPGTDWDGGPFAASFYGLRPNGQARWARAPDAPPAAFQTLGSVPVGAPVVLEHPSDGIELLWALRNGVVGATHLPGGQTPAVLWTSSVGDSLLGGPWLLRTPGQPERLLVAAHPDSLILLERSGVRPGAGLRLAEAGGNVPLQVTVLPGASGGADGAAVVTGSGWYLVELEAAGLAAAPQFVPFADGPAEGPVWAAVNPLADQVRLTVLDAGGELGSWDIAQGQATTLAPLWPRLDGAPVCEPAVADVDGDGRHDVVVATGTRLYAFMADGLPVRGFPVRFADLYPLADSTRIQGPLVIADGTGDGVNEVYFNTTGGHLCGLDATGRLLSGLPLRWGDRTPAGIAVGGDGADRQMWLASGGGYLTGFRDRIDISGRISGVDLLPSAAAARRTSEWLGTAGGPQRNGPTGTARRLEGAAPAAAERDQVYLYPNPATAESVSLRFYSAGPRQARASVHNLEGELVSTSLAPVTAAVVNEIDLPLTGLASGLYLIRLEYDGPAGREIRSLTLAVER